MIAAHDEQRYLDALAIYGMRPILLESDVTTCLVLMGAFHLALRHHHLPASARAVVKQCLTRWGRALATLDPVFQEGVEWGMDPENDVGAPSRRICRRPKSTDQLVPRETAHDA